MIADVANVGRMTRTLIRKVRKEKGITLERLSELTGLSVSFLSRLESDKREVSVRHLDTIASALGVEVGELLVDPNTPDARLPIDIPILSWVSAGDMAREDAADEAIGTLTAAGLPPGDYIALIVKGDSMDRISPPESRIIINRKEKRLVSNACYVIADENGEATYKRYRADPMRFEPVSVNPAHEPIFPDREPLIVGRVRRTVLDM